MRRTSANMAAMAGCHPEVAIETRLPWQQEAVTYIVILLKELLLNFVNFFLGIKFFS